MNELMILLGNSHTYLQDGLHGLKILLIVQKGFRLLKVERCVHLAVAAIDLGRSRYVQLGP